MSYHAVEEQAPALLRAGISDFDSAMSYTGGHLVAAHRGRSVVRIEGGLFLKRFIGVIGMCPSTSDTIMNSRLLQGVLSICLTAR